MQRTFPREYLLLVRMEKCLSPLSPYEHHARIGYRRSLPAGIITTGHSKPFAAWQVAIVTFYASDQNVRLDIRRLASHRGRTSFPSSACVSVSVESIDAWRNNRNGVSLCAIQ